MPRRCPCRIRVCPETIFGKDVDDLFAYTTSKTISVRDHRLGLLHYSFMLLIALYIVVYQLFGTLKYLRFSPAENSVRLTLQQPVKGCNPNLASCEDNFVPLEHLNYCCATNSSCRPDPQGGCRCEYRTTFRNFNCTYMDGAEASVVRDSSILVGSFTHAYRQTRNPSCFRSSEEGSDTCSKVWQPQESTSAFTANIEAFTVLFDHSLKTTQGSASSGAPSAGSSDGLYISSRNMEGLLFVGGDTQMQQDFCAKAKGALDAPIWGKPTKSAPCYVPPASAKSLDFFSVRELLQAAGKSLEEESYPGSGHSARYDGVVLSVSIDYFNSVMWHGLLAEPRYVYRPVGIPQSDFTGTQIISLDYPTVREKKDMHGILIVVKAGGRLADFDFTQLLLQLTTSLTLMAMATIVVNLMAQYALRHRHYYMEAMHERTVDFGDVSLLEEMSEEDFQEELERRRLSTHGTKIQQILRLLEHGWDRTCLAEMGAEQLPRQEVALAGSSSASALMLSARPAAPGAV